MSHALIFMTALVPTTGHADLIKFANEMCDLVTVVVSGRSSEPIEVDTRIAAFMEHFSDNGNIHYYGHFDDNAPQNSDHSQEFWDYWREVAEEANYHYESYTHIIASEYYGKEAAEFLDLEFIPYDIERTMNPVKGSVVRENILNMYSLILPEFRRFIARNYVLFGQESVGKTTLSKLLHKNIVHSSLYPEWAREYLEDAELDVTRETMSVIESGQSFVDCKARNALDNPINIQDTDLYSTEGYYRISGLAEGIDHYLRYDLYDERTTYFLLPDDIPVEPDRLRAAGTERESTYKFWKNILEEFDLNYVEVPKGTLTEKLDFMMNYIEDVFQTDIEPISSFERD